MVFNQRLRSNRSKSEIWKTKPQKEKCVSGTHQSWETMALGLKYFYSFIIQMMELVQHLFYHLRWHRSVLFKVQASTCSPSLHSYATDVVQGKGKSQYYLVLVLLQELSEWHWMQCEITFGILAPDFFPRGSLLNLFTWLSMATRQKSFEIKAFFLLLEGRHSQADEFQSTYNENQTFSNLWFQCLFTPLYLLYIIQWMKIS